MKSKSILTILCIFAISYAVSGQVNFTSSDLPIFIINSGSPIVDEPKTMADLKIIHREGQRNAISDAPNVYNGKIGIELRGQTSMMFPKKAYGFETWDTNGEDLDVEILGFPKESDWVLYAPYSDKSMMRNVLIYELSNLIGQYAVRTQFCEVVLNGDYQGVYVFMERIKRDKNRVDIAKLDPDEITMPDISGGYILRLDKFEDKDENRFFSAFSTEALRLEYQVFYPNADDLQPQQFEYIKNFMQTAENALKSNAYQDENIGFRNYFEANSFIDFLLLNELARNPDAYRISTYLHKQHLEDGGKIKMGPIWDFNLAMGNVDFCIGGSPAGWVLNYNSICPEDYWLIGFWWDRLLSDPEFAKAVENRWKELRQTHFSRANIHQIIDAKAAEVAEAQVRNFQQWDILNTWVFGNTFIGGSYPAEVQFLKDWITQRLDWMDENIAEISLQVVGEASRAKVGVYPNPFSETLKIKLQREENDAVYFNLHDFSGRKVATLEIKTISGTQNVFEVPNDILARLDAGVYFYKIQTNTETLSSGKLVKM